ncbi:MAG: glycosyltransferase [Deltaproteobacteria bacterium]|nr:glycosyltransferase [Deltaproteobacteria bacterium]
MPCYNEGKRLALAPFVALTEEAPISVLFVDDGSTDDTHAILERVCDSTHGRLQLLPLPKNLGKAEAVRSGLRVAVAGGADVVGYLDADGATPPRAMLDLLAALAAHGIEVVLGSRVKRLGAHIQRHELRHYLGRVFATGAALALDLPVYDTQCGAKLFRVTPSLTAALERPFTSKWVFDVELLQRLHRGQDGVAGVSAERFVEVPLSVWTDVAGSKVRPWDAARAAFDLLRIGLEGRRR